MYNYFAILLIIINYVITKYNFIPYPNILSDSPIFIFVSVHVQLKNCRKLNKNFTTEWHSPQKKNQNSETSAGCDDTNKINRPCLTDGEWGIWSTAFPINPQGFILKRHAQWILNDRPWLRRTRSRR